MLAPSKSSHAQVSYCGVLPQVSGHLDNYRKVCAGVTRREKGKVVEALQRGLLILHHCYLRACSAKMGPFRWAIVSAVKIAFPPF